MLYVFDHPPSVRLCFWVLQEEVGSVPVQHLLQLVQILGIVLEEAGCRFIEATFPLIGIHVPDNAVFSENQGRLQTSV